MKYFLASGQAGVHARYENALPTSDASNSDVFKVLTYVCVTLAPLARSARAEVTRTTGLMGYEEEMRAFLDYVLNAYEVHGIAELPPEDRRISAYQVWRHE